MCYISHGEVMRCFVPNRKAWDTGRRHSPEDPPGSEMCAVFPEGRRLDRG